MLRKFIAVMAISVIALQMIAEEDLLLSRSMNADEFNDFKERYADFGVKAA